MRALVCILLPVLLLALTEFCAAGNRSHRRGDYNCHDAPDTGVCRGAFPRWHYDQQNGTCKEFTWGGCGGNGNKFTTRSVCERHCTARAKSGNIRCSPSRCWKSCEFGLMVDEATNCTLCACKPNPATPDDCPQIECPESCPGGYQQDERGCMTCFCRPVVVHHRRVAARSVTCPPNICAMYCQHGFRKDASGCEVCACQTREEMCGHVQCMMQCPDGFKKDSRGCDLCQCREQSDWSSGRKPSHGGRKHHQHHGGGRRPTPGSPVQLPAGESDAAPAQLPSSGVRTTCRRINCRLTCKHGYVKDSFGCSTCACSSPRSSSSSSGGEARRTRAPWVRRTTPTPDPCDNRPMCRMFCENGFKKGADGCDTCACASTPTPDTCDNRPMCMMFCENGFKKGADGCDTCACA